MASFILAATVVEMPVTTGFLKVTVHLSSGALVEMTYQNTGSRRIKNPRIWSMHDLGVLVR